VRVRPPPTVFSAFTATVWGFALVGLAEFVTLWFTGSIARLDAAGTVGILLHLVALNALIGYAAGIALAVTVPPLVNTLEPMTWLRAHVLAPHEAGTSPKELNTTAAWGLGILLAMVPLALVGLVSGVIGHGFNQPRLAGGFAGLMALVGLSVAFVALFPARTAVGWTLNRLAPQGRVLGLPTPFLPIGLVLIAGLVVLWTVTGLDLGAYRLGGLFAIAAGIVVSLGLIGLGRGRVLFRTGALSIGCLAIFAGLGGWSIYGLGDTPQAARTLTQYGTGSHLALNALRSALDRDGDGYSALLGGGDCDDTSAAIGPHAKEIPGNGIDDNCVGGDAPKVVTPPPKPPPPPPPEAKPRPRWNIVFLLIDTLRPDHLGVYGYERNTSPFLDEWSKSAVVFDHVYAHAPNTPRSMPSIFTGRYPSRVEWIKRFSNYAGLKGENETLFEIFQAAGWRTEAVTAHWYFEKAKGIKQGVDHWDNRGFTTIRESNTQSAAPQTTPRVVKRLNTLAKDDKPFVLFAHYFEPHGKYMNHPKVRVFGKKGLVNKYDSEIAFVDHHLKPVFDALDRPELRENTVVVITSDHGEAFKEHGFYFHGRTLYEEESRVPLIVRVPGVKGKRVGTPAALVDILPTLADLTGQTAQKALGRSLAPILGGDNALASMPIFMENLPYPNYKKHVVAMVDPKTLTKVIRNITDNVTEVYDLRTDEGEKKNLLDEDPDAGQKQLQVLNAFIDADPG